MRDYILLFDIRTTCSQVDMNTRSKSTSISLKPYKTNNNRISHIDIAMAGKNDKTPADVNIPKKEIVDMSVDEKLNMLITSVFKLDIQLICK